MCLVLDQFKCRVCGAKSKLQCHHIKPRAGGGTDKLSNLMTLHEATARKGRKTPNRSSKAE
ncbi:HNH endonuclease [Desulfobacter latus]|uniref:HNH endonuclease n=1 Tax=Desulfobacter latus TaxID=2292 RepID=UPI0031B61BE0